MATISDHTTTSKTASRLFAATTKAAPTLQTSQPYAYQIPHRQHYLFTSLNLPVRPQLQPLNPVSPAPQQGILHPPVSSGRGSIQRRVLPQDQTVILTTSNANLTPGVYHPRCVGVRVHGQFKVASRASPVCVSNGYSDLRNRSTNDTLVTLRDQKVRISDGPSLYTLCRLWLRNGFSEGGQPNHGDAERFLPKPLPIHVVETYSQENKGKVEEEEGKESVEHLSTKDLLKRHIKHSKKVRAGLREERLQRIARYRTRLALVLPPQVEQLRNDGALETDPF